jgi:hypothetical protein
MVTKAPKSIRRATLAFVDRPTSTSAVISSMRAAPRGPQRPRRRDLDRAIVLDVDRGAGLFGDLADDRTTLADDVADLLRVDLERDDRRRPLRHLVARVGDDLVHLAEDVQAAFLAWASATFMISA